jgi:PAS domain S-box-containing protein
MSAIGNRLAPAPWTEADRLARIIQLQQAIDGATLEPDELTRRFAQALADPLGWADSAILLKDGGTFLTGRCAELGCTPLAMSRGEGLLGRCFEEGRVVRSAAAASEADGAAPALVAVPLKDGAHTVGVVAAMAQPPARFSESDVQSLVLGCGVFTAALTRARASTVHQVLLDERMAALLALAESENRFRSAMNAARLGVWDWDLASGRITWLGHHEEIFGVAGFDGKYETFLQAVHPEDRHQVGVALTAALTSGSEYSHVHRVVWHDGTIRWVMGRGQFQYDSNGTAVRMSGAVMDVTERRVLEHQLLQAQKIEALGQLAAGIAHEINTPTQYVGDNLRFISDSFRNLERVFESHRALLALAGTSGLSAAIESARRDLAVSEVDFLIEEIPRAARQALDGVERVAGIVRAMKEFAHPSGDDPVPVDLNHLIENTAAVSRNEWKYVADLEFQLDPTLPAVPCHPGEIQQVVLNLIVNAAHAIADLEGGQGGKGTITVATRHRGEVVEVTVSDTGVGIPEAVQPRIFEPFFTTKEVGRGTGQGLAISRDVVVKKHRGSLTFRTEVGRGSTFTVRLPLHPSDALGPEA